LLCVKFLLRKYWQSARHRQEDRIHSDESRALLWGQTEYMQGRERKLSEFLRTVFGKFELRVRKGYYYVEDGFWVKVEGNRARFGITDYLQRTVGDAAFIELVKKGTRVEKQTEIGTLETAKAAISILSPVSGTVEEVNGMLDERPELVNSDPYGEGWFVILTPNSLENDLETLMTADDYFKLMLKKLETEHTTVGA